MKTKFKKNGRRLLAAILCLVMAVMALPMSAFAWTSEEGVIAKCKELALYDTGVTAEYGDRLITLSTCEYSAPNGRLVVVAKKVA